MASFSVVLSAGDGMDHEVLDSVIASTLEDESRRSLYNLANRGDDELVDRCAEENIAYASFFPLGGSTRCSPTSSPTLRPASRLGR